MTDLHDLSLRQALTSLHAGDFSSVEITQARLRRIGQLDEQLHAFLTLSPERAPQMTRNADEIIGQHCQTNLSHPAGKERRIMLRKISMWLLMISLILLSACSAFETTAQREMETAQATLESFFSLLAYGAYEQAAGIYGGEYDILISQNPDISPDDVEELWRNACQNNGYQCLEIQSVIGGRMDEKGFYHFVVEFQQEDGSLFVLGPCCGASETEMPPQSQFEFTVRRDHGVFSVADLPVYIP